jgi:hypothetical protein
MANAGGKFKCRFDRVYRQLMDVLPVIGFGRF